VFTYKASKRKEEEKRRRERRKRGEGEGRTKPLTHHHRISGSKGEGGKRGRACEKAT
jgi:hypothetical protein